MAITIPARFNMNHILYFEHEEFHHDLLITHSNNLKMYSKNEKYSSNYDNIITQVQKIRLSILYDKLREVICIDKRMLYKESFNEILTIFDNILENEFSTFQQKHQQDYIPLSETEYHKRESLYFEISEFENMFQYYDIPYYKSNMEEYFNSSNKLILLSQNSKIIISSLLRIAKALLNGNIIKDDSNIAQKLQMFSKCFWKFYDIIGTTLPDILRLKENYHDQLVDKVEFINTIKYLHNNQDYILSNILNYLNEFGIDFDTIITIYQNPLRIFDLRHLDFLKPNLKLFAEDNNTKLYCICGGLFLLKLFITYILEDDNFDLLNIFIGIYPLQDLFRNQNVSLCNIDIKYYFEGIDCIKAMVEFDQKSANHILNSLSNTFCIFLENVDEYINNNTLRSSNNLKLINSLIHEIIDTLSYTSISKSIKNEILLNIIQSLKSIKSEWMNENDNDDLLKKIFPKIWIEIFEDINNKQDIQQEAILIGSFVLVILRNSTKFMDKSNSAKFFELIFQNYFIIIEKNCLQDEFHSNTQQHECLCILSQSFIKLIDFVLTNEKYSKDKLSIHIDNEKLLNIVNRLFEAYTTNSFSLSGINDTEKLLINMVSLYITVLFFEKEILSEKSYKIINLLTKCFKLLNQGMLFSIYERLFYLLLLHPALSKELLDPKLYEPLCQILQGHPTENPYFFVEKYSNLSKSVNFKSLFKDNTESIISKLQVTLAIIQKKLTNSFHNINKSILNNVNKLTLDYNYHRLLNNFILCSRYLVLLNKTDVIDNLDIYEIILDIYYNESIILLPKKFEMSLNRLLSEYKQQEYKFCLFVKLINLDIEFDSNDYQKFTSILKLIRSMYLESDRNFNNSKNDDILDFIRYHAFIESSKIWYILLILYNIDELLNVNSIKSNSKIKYLLLGKSIKKLIQFKEKLVEIINDNIIQECDFKNIQDLNKIANTKNILDIIFAGLNQYEKLLVNISLINRIYNDICDIYSDYQTNLITYANEFNHMIKSLLFNYLISHNLYNIIIRNTKYFLPALLLYMFNQSSTFLKLLRWLNISLKSIDIIIQNHNNPYNGICTKIFYLPARLLKLIGCAFEIKPVYFKFYDEYLHKRNDIAFNFKRQFLIFLADIGQTQYFKKDAFMYSAIIFTFINLIEEFVKLRQLVDLLQHFRKYNNRKSNMYNLWIDQSITINKIAKVKKVQSNNPVIIEMILNTLPYFFNSEALTRLYSRTQQGIFYDLTGYFSDIGLDALIKYYTLCKTNLEKSVSNINDHFIDLEITKQNQNKSKKKPNDFLSIKPEYNKFKKSRSNDLINLSLYKEFLTFAFLNDIKIFHGFEFFFVEVLSIKSILTNIETPEEKFATEDFKTFDLYYSFNRWIDNIFKIYYYLILCIESRNKEKPVYYKPFLRTIIENIILILEKQISLYKTLGINIYEFESLRIQKIIQLLFLIFHIDDNMALNFIENHGLEQLLYIKSISKSNANDIVYLSIIIEFYYKYSLPLENLIEIQIKKSFNKIDEKKSFDEFFKSNILYHYIQSQDSRFMISQIFKLYFDVDNEGKVIAKSQNYNKIIDATKTNQGNFSFLSESMNTTSYILDNTSAISKYSLLLISKTIIKNYIEDISIHKPIKSFYSSNLLVLLASIIDKYPHSKIVLYYYELEGLEKLLDIINKTISTSMFGSFGRKDRMSVTMSSRAKSFIQNKLTFIKCFLHIVAPYDQVTSLLFLDSLLNKTGIYVNESFTIHNSIVSRNIDFTLMLITLIIYEIQEILLKELETRILFNDSNSMNTWCIYSDLIGLLLKKTQSFSNDIDILLGPIRNMIVIYIRAITVLQKEKYQQLYSSKKILKTLSQIVNWYYENLKKLNNPTLDHIFDLKIKGLDLIQILLNNDDKTIQKNIQVNDIENSLPYHNQSTHDYYKKAKDLLKSIDIAIDDNSENALQQLIYYFHTGNEFPISYDINLYENNTEYEIQHQAVLKSLIDLEKVGHFNNDLQKKNQLITILKYFNSNANPQKIPLVKDKCLSGYPNLLKQKYQNPLLEYKIPDYEKLNDFIKYNNNLFLALIKLSRLKITIANDIIGNEAANSDSPNEIPINGSLTKDISNFDNYEKNLFYEIGIQTKSELDIKIYQIKKNLKLFIESKSLNDFLNPNKNSGSHNEYDLFIQKMSNYDQNLALCIIDNHFIQNLSSNFINQRKNLLPKFKLWLDDLTEFDIHQQREKAYDANKQSKTASELNSLETLNNQLYQHYLYHEFEISYKDLLHEIGNSSKTTEKEEIVKNSNDISGSKANIPLDQFFFENLIDEVFIEKILVLLYLEYDDHDGTNEEVNHDPIQCICDLVVALAINPIILFKIMISILKILHAISHYNIDKIKFLPNNTSDRENQANTISNIMKKLSIFSKNSMKVIENISNYCNIMLMLPIKSILPYDLKSLQQIQLDNFDDSQTFFEVYIQLIHNIGNQKWIFIRYIASLLLNMLTSPGENNLNQKKIRIINNIDPNILSNFLILLIELLISDPNYHINLTPHAFALCMLAKSPEKMIQIQLINIEKKLESIIQYSEELYILDYNTSNHQKKFLAKKSLMKEIQLINQLIKLLTDFYISIMTQIQEVEIRKSNDNLGPQKKTLSQNEYLTKMIFKCLMSGNYVKCTVLIGNLGLDKYSVDYSISDESNDISLLIFQYLLNYKNFIEISKSFCENLVKYLEVDESITKSLFDNKYQTIRVNGITNAKFNIEFFLNEILKHINANISEIIYDEYSKNGSSLGFYYAFNNKACIVDFNTKIKIFRAEMEKLKETSNGVTILSINRQRILEDTITELDHAQDRIFNSNLQINFIGENAIDIGGVKREWCHLLANLIFNPNYGLFDLSPDKSSIYPSANSRIIINSLNIFNLAGILVAEAIISDIPLGVTFTQNFIKQIMGLPFELNDIDEVDLDIAKNLKWLLENPVNELKQNFTTQMEIFGEKHIIELIPNGSKIIVNEKNKKDFVKAYSFFMCCKRISEQVNAFKIGFFSVLPIKLISIFSPIELQTLICGEIHIDIQKLKKNTILKGYNQDDNVIKWFWEIIAEFTSLELSNFLTFVYGASKLPINGFKLTITKLEDKISSLPLAQACFSELKLPNYKSKIDMKHKISLAIQEGCPGFYMIQSFKPFSQLF